MTYGQISRNHDIYTIQLLNKIFFNQRLTISDFTQYLGDFLGLVLSYINLGSFVKALIPTVQLPKVQSGRVNISSNWGNVNVCKFRKSVNTKYFV